ncbi:MAG: hypothetical protein M3A44_02980 [Gammaproteobacteria bacterium]
MKKDQQNPDSATPHKPEADENIDISRRRLAKAGVAVAVLMTVANRPVMGGQGQGCTLSAWMSAGSGPSKPTCGGFSTSYWTAKYDKKSTSSWPSPCYQGGYAGTGWGTTGFGGSNYYSSDNTLIFKKCFGSNPQGYGSRESPSLLDVLNKDPTGKTLAAQACAALLNAADDKVPYGYTVDDVIKLYQANPPGLYEMFSQLNSRS